MRVLVLGACLGSAVWSPGAAEAAPWSIQSDVSADLYAWNNDFHDHDLQLITTAKIAASRGPWRLGASAGYAYARVHSDDDGYSGSISTPLDTVLSANWRHRLSDGARSPSISIDSDVSLPTGTATLHGRQKNVIFDPLLARFDRYGEGLNASLGATVGLPLSQSVALALGGRETWFGSYRPDGDVSGGRIKPGARTSVVGEISFRNAKTIATTGFEVSDDRTSTRDHLALINRGRSFRASASISHLLDSKVRLYASGYYGSRARDRRRDELTGGLVLEPSRREGAFWAVEASAGIPIVQASTLTIGWDYAHAGDSEIDKADFNYLPARKRWRAGVTWTRSMDNGLQAEAGLKYFKYRDEGSDLLLPLNARGLNALFSLSKRW